MRTLTNNELMQFTGGIKNYGSNDEQQIFILGAGIGAIGCAVLLETHLLGTLTGALIGGTLSSIIMNPDCLPRNFKA